MAKKRLIDADALCEFFQERYEYLRNASETPLPGGKVLIDTEIQVGAIIAKEFLDKAKDAPTVDAVEVVHGRWIYHECVSSYDGAISGYSCSECSAFVNEEIFDVDEFHQDFCGHCGAKMDGGNEDG